MKYKQMQK